MLLPTRLPVLPASSTAIARLNISSRLSLSAFLITCLSLFFASCFAIKYPPPPPTAKDAPASITEGVASPNPPARNRATSSMLSQRTSVALSIDGPPRAASALYLADFSIRLSEIPSNPAASAASPPSAVTLLITPSAPRLNPAPNSFIPPRIPSRPRSGAFIWS